MALDRKALLDAALAGYDTPSAASEYLFPPPEGCIVDPVIVEEVGRMLRSTDFNTEFQRAKEDLIGSAINSIRRTVMENVLEVKELARTATDPRVKLAANKDLLDRAGLAPAQKTVAFTPTDYKRLIDSVEDKPAEVVPEAGVRSEEGPEGS